MDTTCYYEAHANEEIDGHPDDTEERRSGEDRRQGTERRRQERRHAEQARAPLTPQEIAALLNGSR